MNFYQAEVNRIRSSCFANDHQLKTVIKTRHFIDHHFDKDLSLDRLASSCFTSKFHLLRLFKRYYGLTPKHYLTTRRIEEAKKCLIKGMTVAETCYLVGFGTPSSFSTLFKQEIGLSPQAFQKEQFLQNV